MGADLFLALSPSTVAWVTEVEAEISIGPIPWEWPPMAVLDPEGPPTLVLPRARAVEVRDRDLEVAVYEAQGPSPDPLAQAATVLGNVIAGRTVATEAAFLPAPLASCLAWVDVGERLIEARARKEPDEVERIRVAAEAARAAHMEVQARLHPGVSELELWTSMRSAIDRHVDRPVPVYADLVGCPSVTRYSGLPSHRTLAVGEAVLADVALRVGGYWADVTSTMVCEEPSLSLRMRHRRVRHSLERAVELIAPGLPVDRLDELLRRKLRSPHHAGHGVGTSFFESPYIAPGLTTLLKPGMVLALEPGSYTQDEGVRIEWLVTVTHDGCEVIAGDLGEI